MLILTRKKGESIRIGEDILISVQSIKGCQVRLLLEAPEAIKISFKNTTETKKASCHSNSCGCLGK